MNHADANAAGATNTWDREPIRPTVWLRVLYTATLITAVFPVALAGSSGWVGLILGTSLLWPLVIFAVPVVLWRVYLVWQYPTTLTPGRTGGLLTMLRGTAIAMMSAGCVAPLALLLQGPMIEALGGVRSDSGIEYIALQIAAVIIGSTGIQGLLIFEWTRLIGLEDGYRRSAMTEPPERESRHVVWLTVAALSMLTVTQIVGVVAVMAQGPRLSSYALLGLIIGVPTTLVMVVRASSLVHHRHEIPIPESTGFVRTVRKLSVAGLVFYMLVVAASLLSRIVEPASVLGVEPASVLGDGALLRLIPPLAILLGPVSLAVLEYSRLLAYERRERSVQDRALW